MSFKNFYTCGEIKHKIRFKHPPALNWRDSKMNLNVLFFADCDFLWAEKAFSYNRRKKLWDNWCRNLNTFRTNSDRNSNRKFKIKIILCHDCGSYCFNQ